MNNFKIFFFIFACFIFPGLLLAQKREDTHPELHWKTIKTKHFQVHFQDGAERSGRTVAKIAEDIYGPITSLYDWKPNGIIHFIIKDHDDNSNGAAFYYDNKVEIWAPQMTFILRGTHNWLRNVVTHEFSHMISLGASRKLPRKIPAFYFQWMGYEKEKRPDVLYGYPNVIASYPIPMTVVPMWLAEGMAQYQAPGLDYDRWDTHRDMLIRTAILADKLHSFDEMGVFGKNSIGNERTYNAGYAFTRYIAQNYHPEALRKLTRSMKKFTRFTVNGAIKDATGVEGKALYERWRQGLNDYYSYGVGKIKKNRVEGMIITKKGIGNVLPAWSPDGKKIAFCGSESADYLTLTSLKVYDTESKKFKTIKGGVNAPVAWSEDGSKFLYSRVKRGKHGSHYYDLYFYDIKKKKEHRLTNARRTLSADLSPDGRQIVSVVQKDGTDNLFLFDDNGKPVRSLTNFSYGEGLDMPHWSPNGKSIVFSQARKHGRDIKLLNVAGGSVSDIIAGQGDARDPVFSPDGKHVYFSWDRTGIFNIYSVKTDGSDLKLWTNVIGGAFTPSLSKDGKLAFSNFQDDGYKIAVIESPREIDPALARYVPDKSKAPELSNTVDENVYAAFKSAHNYDDTKLPQTQAKPYSMTYGQVSFLPRVMIDSNRVKLGTYFYASDILDRYSVLGGFAVNARKDIDAFAMFEYRKLAPTLFLELYGFTRNIKRSIGVIEDYPKKVIVDIGFNILEADIGAYYRLTDHQLIRGAFVNSRYTSKIGDFFFQGNKWVSPMNTYFIGNHFRLKWNYSKIAPGVNSRINPAAGRKIELEYTREYNKFFKDFATNNDYGTPQEIYTNYNVNRVQFDWREYMAMPWSGKHALSIHFRGGWIDRPVDSFFNFFAGGMPGLRGYPFYSIEGRKLLVGRFTYRFPVFTQLQKRFFNITTNNMFIGAFFDYGNAFNQDKVVLSNFRKDVGASLRFSAFSFYGFPTALSIESAYGLDQFKHEGYQYGKEWRFYVTLLFDFMD